MKLAKKNLNPMAEPSDKVKTAKANKLPRKNSPNKKSSSVVRETGAFSGSVSEKSSSPGPANDSLTKKSPKVNKAAPPTEEFEQEDEELNEILTLQEKSVSKSNETCVCADLKRILVHLVKKVNILETLIKKHYAEKATTKGLGLKFQIPCKDYKRVFFMDVIIEEDDQQFKALVTFMANQPAPSANRRSAVNNMLRSVLTDSAAKSFCFTGSEKKFAFQNLKLLKAVMAGIRSSQNDPNLSTELNTSDISDWLRQSAHRMDNRSRNKEKKQKEPKIPKRKRPAVLETSMSANDDYGDD